MCRNYSIKVKCNVADNFAVNVFQFVHSSFGFIIYKRRGFVGASDPKHKGVLTAMAITTVIGTELAIAVVLGFYGGKLLDDRLGTQPWFLIAGILLGISVGIFGVVQTMLRFFKD